MTVLSTAAQYGQPILSDHAAGATTHLRKRGV